MKYSDYPQRVKVKKVVNKKKKARNDKEHFYQVKVIEWCRKNDHLFPGANLIYSIPNGAAVSGRERGRLVREGMKSGVSDLHLPVAKGGYFGLYVEMKHDDGGSVVSDAQTAFLGAVTDEGYLGHICYTGHAAIEVIRDYMNQPRTKPLIMPEVK